MFFNSFEFAVFLILVFTIYWIVLNNRYRAQNAIILIASYVFYSWWDWRFLTLIVISSLTDYATGIALEATDKRQIRRMLLGISLFVNLGFLGVFKYYNFFIESAAMVLTNLGVTASFSTLSVVLPVGISFYTFQTLSYTIDVYRKDITPTRHIIDFLAFVSFFPQLVAGPIERARDLLPQFHVSRTFDVEQAKDGLRQILWGLFKKVVVADTCARHVDYIFSHYHTLHGSDLALGAFFFAFQIYGDFSGYSDIAIGTAKLFGFRLTRNFALPYFSSNIVQFWRRWHISLSSWFRDYVYIPLGGSRTSLLKRCRNILVTFIISGLWHGANWTFVVWGGLHGLYCLVFLCVKDSPAVSWSPSKKYLARIRRLAGVGMTFGLTLIGWIFFRSRSLQDAMAYIWGIWRQKLFVFPAYWDREIPIALLCIMSLIAIEWMQKNKPHSLDIKHLPVVFRWGTYSVLSHLVYMMLHTKQPFIYFQF